MTAPSYTEDLTDINLAEATTDWSEGLDAAWDDGGTPAADGDYPYIQGSLAISQQATKASIASLLYNSGAGITLPTDGAYFVWQIFTSANVLDTKANGGMRVMVGSSTTDFYSWDVGGVDAGRNPYGGWMNHAVNSTVTVDDTVGSPTTTEQYVGAAIKSLTGIGKGNPHAVDALRYGRGSSIFEFGDIGNGYCTFAGFAAQNDADANRWGLLQVIDGGYLYKGKMTLGTVTNAVDFRDTNVSILIDNTEKVTADFNTIEVNNAASRVDWTNVQITSLSTISPGKFIMNANADVNWETCQFTDLGAFTFLSAAVINNTTFRRCALMTTGGATFSGALFDSLTGAIGVTTSSPANAALISDSGFASDGTGNGLEINGTAANITLSGIDFVGYSTTVDADKAIYVNIATGAMTINISGGSGVTAASHVRTAGCTITVSADVTITFAGMKDDTEVRVYKTSDGSEIAGIEDVVAGSPDDRTFAWSAPAATDVYYVIHHWSGAAPFYQTIRKEGYIVPATNTTIEINQLVNRNAS